MTNESTANNYASLKIPSNFMIAGIPIKVVLDPKLFEHEGCIGKTCYAEQSITIDPTLCFRESTEQAFWHEVVHWIFHIIGRVDLCDDDDLVDLIGHFIYQVLSTQEGQAGATSLGLPPGAVILKA